MSRGPGSLAPACGRDCHCACCPGCPWRARVPLRSPAMRARRSRSSSAIGRTEHPRPSCCPHCACVPVLMCCRARRCLSGSGSRRLSNRDVHGLRFDADGPADPGVIAVDSAYVQFRPDDRLQVRVGRIQTVFELDSVVEDGLSRHDSGGIAVDWTDGMHIALGQPKSTRLHYIAQLNRSDRSTNGVGARGPVTFGNGASRVTHFLGLELAPKGSVTQAMVDMTWIPEALADGVQGDRDNRDFLAFTARLAADQHVAEGLVLHPALEIGWMPVTPQLESLGFASRSGRASGLALVAGIDIRPLARGALGLQLARIPAGFIASPDYPANSRSAELRYSWWPIESQLKLDFRYRLRQQMLRAAESDSRRTAHNLQLRATLRF